MANINSLVDPEQFNAVIDRDDLVVTKFQTAACVICRRIEPALMATSERLGEKLSIYNVDAEQSPFLSERFNVKSVPTLILFRKGEEIDRCSGFQSTSMLNGWIAPHL